MALDKPKETNKPTPPVEETRPIILGEKTSVPSAEELNAPSTPGETGLPADQPVVKEEEPASEIPAIEPEEESTDIATDVAPSPWTEPTEHPEDNVVVLCEIFPNKPLAEREYVKGQFDSHTGNFFTTKDGPYKIIDVSRWQHIKE